VAVTRIAKSVTTTNIVGAGLVRARVSESEVGVITPGGHKTGLYRNMRIYWAFLSPSSALEGFVVLARPFKAGKWIGTT
jgi:hypothetical protein